MKSIYEIDIKSIYEIHYDTGHSWLKVPKADLVGYRVRGGHITEFSYQDNDYVYLEEDVDAIKFLMRERKLREIETVWINDGDLSPIRNLPRYRYDPCYAKYIM